MGSSANGSPTKEFFVEMLTRDIELNDAILDLLDNCLDGVVRSCADKDKLQTSDFTLPTALKLQFHLRNSR